MIYADGPGLSKSRTVQTTADEKQPHDAMRTRCLDQLDGLSEQGFMRGLSCTLELAAAVSTDEVASLSFGWDGWQAESTIATIDEDGAPFFDTS